MMPSLSFFVNFISPFVYNSRPLSFPVFSLCVQALCDRLMDTAAALEPNRVEVERATRGRERESGRCVERGTKDAARTSRFSYLWGVR
jgi:hypothetical protein